MERVFNAVSLALFATAIAMFIAIVREVWARLPTAERASFQDPGGISPSKLRARDRALGRAWKVHAELFPNSRKRLLFAALLIAAAASVVAYPLFYMR